MFSVPCGLGGAARMQEQAPDLHGAGAPGGHPAPRYLTPQPTHTLLPPRGSACFPSPLTCYQWLRLLPPVAVRASMAHAELIDFGFPQELALSGSQTLGKYLLN